MRAKKRTCLDGKVAKVSYCSNLTLSIRKSLFSCIMVTHLMKAPTLSPILTRHGLLLPLFFHLPPTKELEPASGSTTSTKRFVFFIIQPCISCLILEKLTNFCAWQGVRDGWQDLEEQWR